MTDVKRLVVRAAAACGDRGHCGRMPLFFHSDGHLSDRHLPGHSHRVGWIADILRWRRPILVSSRTTAPSTLFRLGASRSKGRFMTEVTIGSSASFETELRRFNKLVQQSGILKEARQHQYFEPPSVVRKRKA